MAGPTIANPETASDEENQTATPLVFPETLVLGMSSQNPYDQKICLEGSDVPREVEIRPSFLRKLPEEKSFIIEMIDSDGNNCGIDMYDGAFITSLKLAPNPNNLSINSAKIVTRYNTMTRWVEEHWGDEIDTISFSGYTFSFTALLGNSAPGLSVANRDATASYRYMRSLITFFKKNGYLFQDNIRYYPESLLNADNIPSGVRAVDEFLASNPEFRNNHPRAGLIRERLYIRMTFDYLSLLGYFETFDLTEDSANPFRFLYSAVFKSEKTKYLLG